MSNPATASLHTYLARATRPFSYAYAWRFI
jgi:hypothetical protein